MKDSCSASDTRRRTVPRSNMRSCLKSKQSTNRVRYSACTHLCSKMPKSSVGRIAAIEQTRQTARVLLLFSPDHPPASAKVPHLAVLLTVHRMRPIESPRTRAIPAPNYCGVQERHGATAASTSSACWAGTTERCCSPLRKNIGTQRVGMPASRFAKSAIGHVPIFMFFVLVLDADVT